MAQITNKGRRWIQHGNNHIVLTNNPTITNFQITATIHLPTLATGDRTIRGPQHSSPTPPVTPRFSAGSPISITTRATTRLDGIGGTFFTALIRLNGGFGFTNGGFDGASLSGSVERYDDVANSQTARTAILAARDKCAGFSLNGFGHVVGGENPIGTVIGTHSRLDDVLNVQLIRDFVISRNGLTGYTINGFGFSSCGFDGINRVGTTERYDAVADANTLRTSATARDLLAGFGMNNFGFTACGSTTGLIGGIVATTERFDDVANTQVARVNTTFATYQLTGYSLNGFGVLAFIDINIGGVLALMETRDDIANTKTLLGPITGTPKFLLAGYSLNGFGFHSGGVNTDLITVSNVAQRYDNISETLTSVTGLNTARDGLAGYATNEYFVNYDTMEP